MNHKTNNAQKIRLGYIISFLLLIVALVLTNFITSRLLKQSKQISSTDAMINNLEQTIGYLKDAETGIRGFVIMKDSAYLVPFIGSKQKIDSLYNLLEEQSIDRAYQKGELQKLKVLLEERYSAFNSSIDTFNANNQEMSVFSKMKTRNGKKIMDSLRKQITKMQLHEKKEMETRQADLESIYRITNIINSVAIAISVMLAFFAISTFTKENRARNEADEKATDYRKRLEARVVELRSKNIELTELRSNERFISTGRIARTIAHEVRNPLTNINLALEQLSEELQATPDTTKMLDMIGRNSRRIQQLVADLLNSTRFAELNFETVHINQLLDETLEQLNDRISLYNISVEKNYDASLPPITADGEKLKLAFLNIILNAVEAVEHNTGLLSIKTLHTDDYCKIIVSDNGKGMSADTLQRIFEPYFSRKEKGSGLGLTNTQNIILNHKGFLSVDSEEGAGAVFTIKLPYTV